MHHLESQFRHRFVHAAVKAADLRKLFARGPFVTRNQQQIFVVDGCILTDEELIQIWREGNLNPEGVRAFSERQQRLQPAPQHRTVPKPQAKSARAGRS